MIVKNHSSTVPSNSGFEAFVSKWPPMENPLGIFPLLILNYFSVLNERGHVPPSVMASLLSVSIIERIDVMAGMGNNIISDMIALVSFKVFIG